MTNEATLEHFNKKFHNREISEWKFGEWESQQPVVTSIINHIAQKMGFRDLIYVGQEDREPCAEFGQFAAARRINKTIIACKPFFQDLTGLNGLEKQEDAEGIIAHEIGHLDSSLPLQILSRYEEIKADLYTLRNAQLARALRNRLLKQEKMAPLEMEIAVRICISSICSPNLGSIKKMRNTTNR